MLRPLAGCVLFALLTATAAQADTRQAQFEVRVTVAPRITLAAVEEPARLDITSADITRGYVDVTARYRVESNSRRGWLLQLTPRTGLADRVEVQGFANPVVVGDEGVELYRSPAGSGEEFALDYRVVLKPGARPGRYALPLHLSATLL